MGLMERIREWNRNDQAENRFITSNPTARKHRNLGFVCLCGGIVLVVGLDMIGVYNWLLVLIDVGVLVSIFYHWWKMYLIVKEARKSGELEQYLET